MSMRGTDEYYVCSRIPELSNEMSKREESPS